MPALINQLSYLEGCIEVRVLGNFGILQFLWDLGEFEIV